MFDLTLYSVLPFVKPLTLKGKAKTILVKLISSAGTGYFYTAPKVSTVALTLSVGSCESILCVCVCVCVLGVVSAKVVFR